MSDVAWVPPEYGPVIPVPAWVAGPFERVMRDLQLLGPVPLRTAWTATGNWQMVLWLQEVGEEPSCTGLPLHAGEPAVVEVELADQLQEQVFPETEHAWAQARPACPGHAHPAAPAVVDDAAWWTCPRTGERLWRIGEVPA